MVLVRLLDSCVVPLSNLFFTFLSSLGIGSFQTWFVTMESWVAL